MAGENVTAVPCRELRAVKAYIGLGANTGDRESNIRTALDRLASVPGVAVRRVSTLRETAPVGGPPQGDYLNGAAEIEVTLPPEALLSVLKELEREAGRDFAAERNAARPLDLDILLYGDLQVDSQCLQIPHPRLREREFVCTPLTELGVDLEHVLILERPHILRTPEAVRAHTKRWRQSACKVGMVPTMGALHDGHASLFRRAQEDCDRVIATIFVNPLQFAAGEDLDAYPRTFDSDLEVMRREGVDAVFVPLPDVMYGEGFCSHIAVGAEARELEGATRPDHFSGVVTVVCKLANLTGADLSYYGQKDAQQVAVLRRLYRDLDLPGEIVECPTHREADGLARSSRNVYLGPEDRAASTVLFRAMSRAQAAHAKGERRADVLLALAQEELAQEPRCAVDYLELRCEGSLLPLPEGPVERARMLVAARFEGAERVTRLIDNLSLGGSQNPVIQTPSAH